MDVVELAADAPGHGFDEYVERHADGTLFHGIRWRDVITRHFAHRPRYLEARDGGRRVGVLPLFETRSLLSGRALISVPYAVYGGPLADNTDVADALIESASQIREREELAFVELRSVHSHRDDLPGVQRYATFRRELPSDPDDCLGMIRRKSRATTRQARDRHGMQLIEGPELLDAFHQLFILNKQRLGSPSFSKAFFADILRWPGSRLHGVVGSDELLVCALSFEDGDTFNPYWSGSLPIADRLGASNFLYWQLMCEAVKRGFRTFDFGRSRVDTGPYHFKRHMGFEPAVLGYRYVLPAGGQLPEVNPANPRYSLPRLVLRNMPYPLARVVGPQLMAMVP